MQIFLIVVLGVVGFFVVILSVYVGGNWLLRHFEKPRSPSEESLRRYRDRLLNPRWEELEKYFGQSIPERIKLVYTKREIISRHDIRVHKAGKTFHVANFLPADIETLNEVWPVVKESANFPLATNAFGDCYYIPLTGHKSEQCPVMCYYHDGNDSELVSSSLEEFWKGIDEIP